jgi:hypothetical protein
MAGFFKRRAKSLLDSLLPVPAVSTLLKCHFPRWRYCHDAFRMPWEVFRVKTQIQTSGWTVRLACLLSSSRLRVVAPPLWFLLWLLGRPPTPRSPAPCATRLGVCVRGSSRFGFLIVVVASCFSWSSLSSVVAAFAAWVALLARLSSSLALICICNFYSIFF